jgi:hypothetical protein
VLLDVFSTDTFMKVAPPRPENVKIKDKNR